ncbi:MAG: hypothetical protein GQ529_00840 [Methyloprofundus sp.]|nr:hypothetical protein [Methyloprofundus sp.]
MVTTILCSLLILYKLNNHPLKAGGLESLATESRDTGRIALLPMFTLTL